MLQKVLHVVTRIDTGGISTFISNYYNQMDKSKIQFDVVAIDTGIPQGCHNLFNDYGMNVYYMPDQVVQRAKYLYTLIKKNKYDTVHCHIDLQCAFYLGIAALANVKNRISHCHLSKDNPGTKNAILRKVLNAVSTKKFGASDLSIKAVFGNNQQDAKVLRNAIDLEKFSFDPLRRISMRKELEIQENEIILGFVGRITYLKNVIFLNKVLEEAIKSNPNVRLLVVGEGELYEEMEKDLIERKIQNKVTFLGNRYDVNELMWAMDILLLPSFAEGLPLVLVESQGASLMSLVSSKITKQVQLTDYIEYLGIENEDLTSWVDKINSLGYNYKRDSNVKKTITEKGFNIKEEAQNLTRIYQKTS